MKDRLALLLKKEGLIQKEFSEKTGIKPSSLSSILKGNKKLSINDVESIHKHYPTVSIYWLLFGEGEMYIRDNMSQQAQTSPDETPEPAEVGATAAAVPQQIIREIIYKEAAPRQIREVTVFFDNDTIIRLEPTDAPKRG